MGVGVVRREAQIRDRLIGRLQLDAVGGRPGDIGVVAERLKQAQRSRRRAQEEVDLVAGVAVEVSRRGNEMAAQRTLFDASVPAGGFLRP